jgi:DNA replication protein DnaC
VLILNIRPGDKLFVDFTGKKLVIVDKQTGEMKELEVFVAVFGFSSYIYMEATASQKKEDFIAAVENALQTPQHEHLTGDEQLAFLIEAEYDYRSTKRIRNAIARANFRYSATVEEIDFNQSRNLDKNVFLRLADCSFIDKMEDVIFTGSAGVGKSKLASALALPGLREGL